MARPPNPDPERDHFQQRIRRKQDRRLRARRDKRNAVWSGIGTFGMVGWSIAIPTLIGVAAGLWLDARSPQSFSWTLTLLVGGVILGSVNAWYWVQREHREMFDRRMENGDEDVTDDLA